LNKISSSHGLVVKWGLRKCNAYHYYNYACGRCPINRQKMVLHWYTISFSRLGLPVIFSTVAWYHTSKTFYHSRFVRSSELRMQWWN